MFRYKDAYNREETEIYAEYLEAPSIQSGKAKLTKIANETELFSWIQSWDNEKRSYTGKDLRWKPWCKTLSYKQKDGTPVEYSYRRSEKEFGEIISTSRNYGTSAHYIVDLTLYWGGAR